MQTNTNAFFRLTFLLFVVTGLAACGNGKRIEPENLTSVGGNLFQVVSGACPANEEGAPNGSCSMVSPANLGGVDSGASFALRFRLGEGGSVTLHAYSTNLSGGVDLKFWREGEVLRFSGTIGGQSVDHSRRFTGFRASEVVALQIDVHNDEAPTHLIIWPATAAPTFALGDKLVNSGLCGIGNNPNYDCSTQWGTAAGTGSSLGITLVNATLYSAAPSAPKYEE